MKNEEEYFAHQELERKKKTEEEKTRQFAEDEKKRLKEHFAFGKYLPGKVASEHIFLV